MFAKVLSISDDADVALVHAAELPQRGRDRRAQGGGRGRPQPEDAKVLLAKEITARFHSAQAADAAEQDFVNRSKGGVPDEIPEVALAGAPLGIAQLLKQAGLAPSTSEANRLIDGGGVRVDSSVVSDKGAQARGRHVRRAGRQAQVRARHPARRLLRLDLPQRPSTGIISNSALWSARNRAGSTWSTVGAPRPSTATAARWYGLRERFLAVLAAHHHRRRLAVGCGSSTTRVATGRVAQPASSAADQGRSRQSSVPRPWPSSAGRSAGSAWTMKSVPQTPMVARLGLDAHRIGMGLADLAGDHAQEPRSSETSSPPSRVFDRMELLEIEPRGRPSTIARAVAQDHAGGGVGLGDDAVDRRHRVARARRPSSGIDAQQLNRAAHRLHGAGAGIGRPLRSAGARARARLARAMEKCLSRALPLHGFDGRAHGTTAPADAGPDNSPPRCSRPRDFPCPPSIEPPAAPRGAPNCCCASRSPSP